MQKQCYLTVSIREAKLRPKEALTVPAKGSANCTRERKHTTLSMSGKSSNSCKSAVPNTCAREQQIQCPLEAEKQ